MDNLNEIAPGEKPADTDANTASEKLPKFGDDPSPLDDLSPAELLEAMEESEYGETPDAEPAAPAAVEEAPAPAEATEPEAIEEPAPPADTDTPPRAPQRLSVRSLPADQQVELAAALDMVRRGEAPDIKTALGIAAGEPAPASPASAATPNPQQEPPAPETTAKVEEIKTRIEDLSAQRDQADDDFDRPKFRQLTKEIDAAHLDLIRAEIAAKEAATAAREQAIQASAYDRLYNAAVDEVEAAYPQAADDDSAFNRILDDRVTAARARGDARLKDPTFIKGLADEVAADLGITKGASKAPATPAPAKPSRPVGSDLAPGHQTAARPTREQLVKEIHAMPIDELEAMICTE